MTSDATQLDQNRMRGLLLRNWMTHDAMWFATAVDRVGIEETNHMNRSAVHSMAQVEAKRIAKIFELGTITRAEDLRRFFELAMANVIPDFMDFQVTWAPDNRSVCFQITKCFAYDGVTMLGVADRYECGIYERIHGWLEALGVDYCVEPATTLCTMHHEGTCTRRYQFGLA